MKFKIKCEFIAPLVSFSTKDVVFRCEHVNTNMKIVLKINTHQEIFSFFLKDGVSLPTSQTKYLTISNISSLDLNAQVSVTEHYKLIEGEIGILTSEMVANIKTGSSIQIGIIFDTSFKRDFHNQVVNGILTIGYLEHQHSVLFINSLI
jgi:hypothetical protein